MMLETPTPAQTLEALRRRAQWYREYAMVCGGDNGWCVAMAAHNDRLADKLERTLANAPPEN